MKRSCLFGLVVLMFYGCGTDQYGSSQLYDDASAENPTVEQTKSGDVSTDSKEALLENKVYHWGTDELEKVYDPNKVLVFDFFATWCGPCRMLSTVMEELAKESDKKYIVIKVDVDSKEYVKLKENYLNPNNITVSGLPTVVIMNTNIFSKKVVGFNQINVYEGIIKEANEAKKPALVVN